MTAENANGTLMSYIIGKAEGHDELWHGHVTALTVAPEFRRLGLARTLMNFLERVSEKVYNTYFVDLFVRSSNSLAIGMYENFGYTTYRRVLDYYTGHDPEDALGKYAQSTATRRIQKKYCTTQAPDYGRRVRMVKSITRI
ncbi:N-alpha-acetyltransferase 20 [Batrachochytrium dendrobatidis]